MMFKRKKDQIIVEDSETKNDFETDHASIPKPQICLIDFESEVVESINKRGFNIREATLGLPISVPNNKVHDSHLCLLNFDLPTNIHEYDIIAIDMEEKKAIPYEESENIRENHKSNSSLYFYTEFPQTVFDSRAFSAQILQSGLDNIKDRNYILIVFASQKEEYEYTLASMKNDGYRVTDSIKFNTYSNINSIYFEKNLYGKETEVVEGSEILRNLLNATNNLFHYEVVFYHPTERVGSQLVKKENFLPLLVNGNKEIVSYLTFTDNTLILVFPQMKAKEKILIPLLEEILPSVLPKIFPYSTLFSWKDNEEYWLPNHKQLNEEKIRIEQEHKEKLSKIDMTIKANIIEHAFLHDLITETDEKLVDAVKKYLEWLGFENVKKMDCEDKLKEEDLQIELSNGLLIIEIKGIGGTSKDSDCSQISKIKYRRCKERGKFDVIALYIVNHQRYLPPKQRRNPPFSDVQITDAENDERGLLTTWDLFKGYYSILNGIITKEDARNQILCNGLVKLTPYNLKLIGKVTEIFKNGSVFILTVDNTHIKVGDSLIILIDECYQRVNIINLQLNNNNVNEVTSGEVGFLIDKSIKKNALVFFETAVKN